MSPLRRSKPTTQDQVADLLTAALKGAAVGVAGHVAGKGAKAGAKKGAKTAAKKGGKTLGRRLVPFAVIGGVLIVARKAAGRGKSSSADAWQSSANGSPTPVAPPEPATRQ